MIDVKNKEIQKNDDKEILDKCAAGTYYLRPTHSSNDPQICTLVFVNPHGDIGKFRVRNIHNNVTLIDTSGNPLRIKVNDFAYGPCPSFSSLNNLQNYLEKVGIVLDGCRILFTQLDPNAPQPAPGLKSG